MAACGGIHHIFDNQIPENVSSFIDSLSSSPWSKIKPPNPIDHHSFTELFGELHFKENPNTTTTRKQEEQEQEQEKWRNISKFSPYHKRSESSSSMNSESLQLCTEGIGFESLDNLEDLKILDFQSSMRECERSRKEKNTNKKKGKERGLLFPPPISSIGGNNNVGKKPCVSFESYREDGRFILKEIRIASQECLHACREDGRLRLSFVQQSDNEEEDEFELDEEDERGEGMNHGDQEEEEGEEDEEEGKEAKINFHDYGRGD